MRLPAPDARCGGVSVRHDHVSSAPLSMWGGAAPKPKPPGTGGGPPWAPDPIIPSEPCPDCVIQRWQSAVIFLDSYTSTMEETIFHDKTGLFHSHNSNIKTTWYTCTRGHSWATQEQIMCPNCTWPDPYVPPLLRSS